MKRHYHNLPQPMTLSDYEDTLALATETLSREEGVAAVYRFGTQWQPGVSDIDILVVTNPDAQPHIPAPWGLSDKATYLFTHRYLTMDMRAAKSLYSLFPQETTTLKHVWGVQIEFDLPKETLPSEEYRVLIAGIFFDLLVNKLLSLAGSMYLASEINVRQRIGELHSLRYSELLLHSLSGYALEPTFKEKLRVLRDAWFEHKEDESLLLLEEVSKEAVSVILAMTEQFATYTATLGSSDISSFKNERYTINFVDSWSADQFLLSYRKGHLRLSSHGRKFEHDTLLMPKELGLYLDWYTQGEGGFGKKMKRCISPVHRTPCHPQSGFLHHVTALESAFEDYCQSRGVHKIPYAYGFRPVPSLWRNLVGWWILKLWSFHL